MLAVVINVIVFFGILNYFIVIYTAATYSFRTAERSLWKTGFLKIRQKSSFRRKKTIFGQGGS
jgi:hypothetical protein